MKHWLMIGFLLLGMAFGVEGQGIAPAFEAKLKTLLQGSVPQMSPEALAAKLHNPVPPIILDTRAKAEYQVSHLPGAVFVDYATFDPKAVKGMDKGRPVVVYCSVGYRSEKIGEKLQQLGFQHVHNLYGGIFEWVNEGHPVVDHLGKPTDRVHTYNADWSQWLRRGRGQW